MRLVFAGTPAAAVPSLDALLKSRHEVAAVITRPAAPAGRGRRVGPSPVAERAAEVGLEVLKPPTPRDEGFLRHLRALAPDCCPVTAYGALIPQAALEIPRHGWVNLHFSLLPAWRGAAPVAHAIAHGDDITGATTFRLVAELDAGPAYGVVTEPIGEQDTADDPRVRWGVPAQVVARQIRACTPAPGAWTMLGGTRLKLWPVRPCPPPDAGGGPAVPGSLAPGELWAGRAGVFAGTATRPVELSDVQPPGKRRMAAAEWARGLHLDQAGAGQPPLVLS